ncbi:MAG TPA: type IV pili twitching motility protein PilT, partial [Rhodoglobus sp.]|nr:type IV pili twitching motility protein PilT [Rhodoglobus sp.]
MNYPPPGTTVQPPSYLNAPPPSPASAAFGDPAPDLNFAPPVAPRASRIDPSVVDATARASTLQADPDLILALEEVLRAHASDLHVTVNAVPMIRVDGGLRPIESSGVWDRAKVTSALRSILTPQQVARFDEEHELDLAYTISANARFRVNIYQQRNSMGAAFRLIPTDIKQLSELGVPESVANFATLARGL